MAVPTSHPRPASGPGPQDRQGWRCLGFGWAWTAHGQQHHSGRGWHTPSISTGTAGGQGPQQPWDSGPDSCRVVAVPSGC